MRSVLLYRIGSLGDTLISLPALWAVREHFRDDKITLLCDYHPGKPYVLASDLLAGTQIVDDFLRYPIDQSALGRMLMPVRMARLLMTLRGRRFDTLVYLAPTGRFANQVERDRKFFRAAGIREFIGMDADFLTAVRRPPAGTILPSEADELLSHIAAQIPVPPPGHGKMDLGLGPKEQAEVAAWLKTLPPDGGRPWIALGPGSKMPAKIWPKERYFQVVRELVERFDVWPVIFGGKEDRIIGDWFLRELGRGYNAAGALGLRASARAISRSKLYLGNDTGTMHMAAAVGVSCVAIFSSRSYMGIWYPYGPGHRVFRTQIECEGCDLVECVERKMECVMRIETDQVRDACVEMLGRVPAATDAK